MADQISSLIVEVSTNGARESAAQINKLAQEAKRTEQAAKHYRDETHKVSDALDRLEREQRQANKQVKDSGDIYKKNRGGFRAMRGATQQLSYQLQDVAVQAQMGTDRLRIMAQQGPQILSIFGPGGAIAGALLAFGALIANAVLGADALDSSVDKLDETMDDLADTFEETSSGARALSAAIGELADRNRELARIEIAKNIQKYQNAMSTAADAIRESVDQQLTSWYKIMDVTSKDLPASFRLFDEAVAKSGMTVKQVLMQQGRALVGPAEILRNSINDLGESFDISQTQAYTLLRGLSELQRTGFKPEDVTAYRLELGRLGAEGAFANKSFLDFYEAISDPEQALFIANRDLGQLQNTLRLINEGADIKSLTAPGMDSSQQAEQDYQKFFERISSLELSADERFFRSLDKRRSELKAQLEGQTIDYTMYQMGIAELNRAAASRTQTMLEKQFKSATDALSKEWKANADVAEKKKKLKEEELRKARETQDLLAQLYSESDPEVIAFEKKQNVISDKLRERLNAGRLDITEYYRALAVLEQNYTDFVQQQEDLKEIKRRESLARQAEAEQQRLLNQMTLMERWYLTTKEAIDNVEIYMVQFANTFEQSLGGAIEGLLTGTKSFKDAFKDMTKAILTEFLSMVAQMIAKRIAFAVFGAGIEKAAAGKLAAYQVALSKAKITEATLNAYVSALATPVIGPAIAPGAATAAAAVATGMATANDAANITAAALRATGGQVRSGSSYLVGEQGPELLTMGTSGRIASNDQLKKAIGGGESIQIVNNIDARGADASVDMKIRSAVEQSSQATIAVIQDLMRRRRFV